MTKILLVEDRPQHIAEAKQLLEERIRSGIITGVDYASTLHQAMQSLRVGTYDGVISDVFFPSEEGEMEAQNGTTVAEQALFYSVPVVLVTSTYHHGTRTQPVCEWGRERGMELVDRYMENERDAEDSTKNWSGAFFALAYIMEGKELGEITVSERGIYKKIIHRGESAETRLHWGRILDPEQRQESINAVGFMHDPLLKKTVEKYCREMSF
ncbi:MAG: response regulator [Nanoarchaeota archaeon]